MLRDIGAAAKQQTMNWDKLPLELRVLILSMRHEMRVNTQAMIARCWKKFDAPKKVAHYLVERERFGLSMSVMFPETADIMEYCVKVLSGQEKPDYWNSVLAEVEYEMWVNKYSGGPGVEYMSRVDHAFKKLIQKFKYHPNSGPLETQLILRGHWPF